MTMIPHQQQQQPPQQRDEDNREFESPSSSEEQGGSGVDGGSAALSTNATTKTASSGGGGGGKSSSSYYNKGSTELAVDTPLTLNKLEKRRKLTVNSNRLVIVLVGLPARGKSFISRKLQNFLLWTGNHCKIFNVGKYRRAAHAKITAATVTATAASAEEEKSNDNNSNNKEREKIGSCDANFFDPNNEEAALVRKQAAEDAMNDMLSWLDGDSVVTDDEDGCAHVRLKSRSFSFVSFQQKKGSSSSSSSIPKSNTGSAATTSNYNNKGGSTGGKLNNSAKSNTTDTSTVSINSDYGVGGDVRLNHDDAGRIAIFDATNSTDERRRWILEQCTATATSSRGCSGKRKQKRTGVIFVESICDDRELLEENFRYKIKTSPDFAGMSEKAAIEDLKSRVEKYESQYETITDDSTSYIKIYNLSSKMLVNHIYGRMSKMIVPALMAWHIGTRPVFLCRPGKTEFMTTNNNNTAAATNINNDITSSSRTSSSSSTTSSNRSTNSINANNSNSNSNDNNNENNEQPQRRRRKSVVKSKSDDDLLFYSTNDCNNWNLSFKQQRRLEETKSKSRKRGLRLGPLGKMYSDALLRYCALEGNQFLERRASVMDKTVTTGTSISGIDDEYLPTNPLSADSIYWLWESKSSSNDDDNNRSKNNTTATTEPNNIDKSSYKNYVSIDEDEDGDDDKNNVDEDACGGGVEKETFPMKILVSTMPRAYETVAWGGMFQLNVEMLSNLNPIDKGDYSGYELYEMKDMNPEWYNNHLEVDPFHTRFPGGESYSDLISRLGHVLISIEQQVIPTLVVSHISILQVLIAYFRNTPIRECPSIEIPMHTVLKFEPVRGGGFKESQYSLGTTTATTRTNNDDSNNNNNSNNANNIGRMVLNERSTSDENNNDDDGPVVGIRTPIWGDHLVQ